MALTSTMRHTTLQDLGALEGSALNRSLAINASGQVTGTDFNADGENAFLWDGTALHDLNALVDGADPLQSFVTLLNGIDFNDLGQILANPGTLALLGLGLLGLGWTRRKASHSCGSRRIATQIGICREPCGPGLSRPSTVRRTSSAGN